MDPKGKVAISLTDLFFFLSFTHSPSLSPSPPPFSLSHPPNPPLSLPVSLVTHILIDARLGVTGWCWHESSSKEKDERESGSEERRRPAPPAPHPLALLPGWLSLTLGHRIHRSL